MPVWQLLALNLGAIRSCINCEHFDKATEGCKISGGMRPPAVVIALGCDKWEQEIPF